MRLAKSEQLILTLLADLGPSYGLQLVTASRGRIKRGGVYVTLGRMEDKSLVISADGEGGRRVYRPSALGERALLAARVFAGQLEVEAKA
jgi:DNA-binding PadR family transcriptional regulator